MKLDKVILFSNIWFESLGLMYVSSIFKKFGIETRLIIGDEMKPQKLAQFLEEFSPDMIAFSFLTGDQKWVIEKVQEIRRSGYAGLIILGGSHTTYFPEIIENEGVDMVCMGEGERPLINLIEKIKKGEDYSGTKGLWVKKDGKIFKNEMENLIENLDEIPFPDRKIYYSRDYFKILPIQYFISGRGCPFECAFCYNYEAKKMLQGKGKYVRKRSPENLVEEISQAISEYKIDLVRFVDDTFVFNKGWSEKFFSLYRNKIRRPFICNVRADVFDEDFAKMLSQSGCYKVSFGIETGNERIRNKVLEKKVSDQQIIKTAGLLHQHHIKFLTYNMVGIPGESFNDALETVNLNRKIKTDFPWCSMLQPYPKTKIYNYFLDFAQQKDTDIIDQFSRTFFSKSVLNIPDKQKLYNLSRLFYFCVKSDFLFKHIKFFIQIPGCGWLYDFMFFIATFINFKKRNAISYFKVFLFSFKQISFLR